jgi:hypothetical protein
VSLPEYKLSAVGRPSRISHPIPLWVVDGTTPRHPSVAPVDLLTKVVAAIAVKVKQVWLEEATNAVVASRCREDATDYIYQRGDASHASDEHVAATTPSVHDCNPFVIW